VLVILTPGRPDFMRKQLRWVRSVVKSGDAVAVFTGSLFRSIDPTCPPKCASWRVGVIDLQGLSSDVASNVTLQARPVYTTLRREQYSLVQALFGGIVRQVLSDHLNAREIEDELLLLRGQLPS
jgi:hypothetical protein